MKFDATSIKRALFRFTIYGSLCIAGEVAFVTIIKLGRLTPDWINWLFQYQFFPDPRLGLDGIWQAATVAGYGQSSLWMFLVFGSGGLFGLEFAYNKIKNWFWLFRGLIYMVIILAFECVWGWIFFYITGYQIWYYVGTLTILTFTSLAIAPMWFMVGLLSENIVKIVERVAETEVD